MSKKWLKDGAKILMDRESDVVVTGGDETGRWKRLNIFARQKRKKKKPQDSPLNNPFMKGKLEVLRVQGREFPTGARVYVRRELTLEGKKSDQKNEHGDYSKRHPRMTQDLCWL